MSDTRDRAGADDAESWPDWRQRSVHLGELADALRPFALLVRHGGPVPELHISDPLGTRRGERVVVSRDRSGIWWYWWAHGERITPVEDLEEAARRVARVVHAVTG